MERGVYINQHKVSLYLLAVFHLHLLQLVKGSKSALVVRTLFSYSIHERISVNNFLERIINETLHQSLFYACFIIGSTEAPVKKIYRDPLGNSFASTITGWIT